MKRSFLCLIFCTASVVSTRLSSQCNTVQTLTSTQNFQLQVLQPQLDTALFYENFVHIDSLQSIAKSIYATQAGIPDALQSSTTLSTNQNWLSMPNAILLSRLLISADSMIYVDIWKVCKGMAPTAYLPHSIFLRTGAETCIGLLRIAEAETDPTRANAYRSWAKRGLDTLLTMQLPSGAFPFPDLRTYNDPVFTPIINNYLQSLGPDSILVLQNGWIIDDSGTGEFKFDAGVIGGAFAEAFLYTNDIDYKAASENTAAYLLPLHFNSNFNYNTFDSYGLVKAWNISQGNSAWRTRAVTTLRYSVLPGQINTGRWMDGHNAKSVYHSIIIHNSSAVLASIDPADPLKDTLAGMLCEALRNFIATHDTCGSTSGFDGLLRAYALNITIVPQSLHDSLTVLIGRYIQQAAINGYQLDVYTMGLYLELVGDLTNTANLASKNSAWSIYPNPSNGILHLTFRDSESSPTQMEIYNSAGQLLLQYSLSTNQTDTFEINTSSLSPGLYFVRLSDGTRSELEKYIIPQ